MSETPVISRTRLKIDYQDIAAVGAMVFLSLAANFAEYFPFSLDKKYLIGALGMILAIALLKYLQAALIIVIVVLIVGANIPADLADYLKYAPWMMTLTLIVLVVLASLNKIHSVPKWLDPKSDNEPFSEKFDGAKALFHAINNGRGRSVRALLRQGVNPDVRNKRGETALIYAAARHEEYIVRLLLHAGANTSLTDESGKNALKIAESRHQNVTKELLKHSNVEK